MFRRNVYQHEALHLTVNICGRAHCDPVFGILVFLLQTANESFALFCHTVSGSVFQCDVSLMLTNPMRTTESIFVIWCRIRLKGKGSRE